ncbi:MAG: hypothetical protein C0196_03805 [Dictyoglomus turgidum]|nr:MAG: hypothetical protein C0196_03805 [Dictyoglomus turgidum]
MQSLVISRLRILTFLFMTIYLLTNAFFNDFRILILMIFAILYSSVMYYFSAREKVKESFVLSLIDLFVILLYLFLIDAIAVKFLFLIYLPTIKEILYRRIKNAYMISFLGNLGVIILSFILKESLPLKITTSLIPISFLLPYLSSSYLKEMEGS